MQMTNDTSTSSPLGKQISFCNQRLSPLQTSSSSLLAVPNEPPSSLSLPTSNLAQLQQLQQLLQSSQQNALPSAINSIQMLEQETLKHLLRQHQLQQQLQQQQQQQQQQQSEQTALLHQFLGLQNTAAAANQSLSTSLRGDTTTTAPSMLLGNGTVNFAFQEGQRTDEATGNISVRGRDRSDSDQLSGSSTSQRGKMSSRRSSGITNHNSDDKDDEEEDKNSDNPEEEQSCDTFPFKVYRMLVKVETDNKEHIVSFTTTGRAFRIHKPTEFATQIMPEFFNTSRMSSFQRQLNLYGFRRITEGPEKGAYCHEFFRKDGMTLCHKIKRKRNTGKRVGVFAGANPPSTISLNATGACINNMTLNDTNGAAVDTVSYMTIRQLLANQSSASAAGLSGDHALAAASILNTRATLSDTNLGNWSAIMNNSRLNPTTPSSLVAALSLNQKLIQQQQQANLIQQLLQTQQQQQAAGQQQQQQQGPGNLPFHFI